MVAQAYEYTGGLGPGAPACALGRPLSARLGPGLLGGVFDGLRLARIVGWLARQPENDDEVGQLLAQAWNTASTR